MYNIPIVGIIGEDFVLNDLIKHLSAAKDETDLMLLVGSNGGDCDESKKMKNLLLASGKILHSSNIGNVASAASELFTLPPLENRLFDAKKGQFLIHNPWTEIQGDAAYLSAVSTELKKIESEMAKHYQNATTADISIINLLMDEDKPLTVEQIESLGFSRIKSDEPFTAVAKFKPIKNMEVKEAEEKIGKLELAMAKLSKLFTAKSLMLNDASGTELEFPNATSEEDIKEGSEVMISGAPATGTYTMPSGVQVVAVEGKVTEVIAKASEDVEALKAELEAAKNENAELKANAKKTEAANAEIQTQVVALGKELVTVKALFTDNKPTTTTAPEVSTPVKSQLSFKKRKNK